MKELEKEVLEINKDIDELMKYVFKQMDFKYILSMDSEDVKIMKSLFNTMDKSKNLLLLMARNMDRQEEVLARLDRYLDEQERGSN